MICELTFGMVCLLAGNGFSVSSLQGSAHGYLLESEIGRVRLFVSDFIAAPDVSRMEAYCATQCAFVAGACTDEFCEYYVSDGDRLTATRIAVYGSADQRRDLSRYLLIAPRGGYFPLTSVSVKSGRLSLP